jgi:hypothetical protein
LVKLKSLNKKIQIETYLTGKSCSKSFIVSKGPLNLVVLTSTLPLESSRSEESSSEETSLFLPREEEEETHESESESSSGKS